MQRAMDPMTEAKTETPSAAYVLRRRYGPARHVIAAVTWVTVINLLLQPVAVLAAAYTWNGGAGPAEWTTAGNWTGGTDYPGFAASDTATLNTGSAVITLSGTPGNAVATVTLSAAAELAPASGQTLTVTQLAGTANLTKSDPGQVTITGAAAAGRTSGNTTINGGTVRIQNATALNASGGTRTINAGVLELTGITLNQTLSMNNGSTLRGVAATSRENGVVTVTSVAGESVTFAATSGNTLTLADGDNDLTGGTATTTLNVLGGGTVLVAGDTSPTHNIIGNWNVTGGTTLQMNRGEDAGLGNTANDITLENGILSLQATSDWNPASTRVITIGAGGGTFNVGSGRLITFDDGSQLTGSGATTKAGAGSVYLVNTFSGFTGDINLTGGLMRYQKTAVSGTATITSTASGGTIELAGAGGATDSFTNPIYVDSGSVGLTPQRQSGSGTFTAALGSAAQIRLSNTSAATITFNAAGSNAAWGTTAGGILLAGNGTVVVASGLTITLSTNGITESTPSNLTFGLAGSAGGTLVMPIAAAHSGNTYVVSGTLQPNALSGGVLGASPVYVGATSGTQASTLALGAGGLNLSNDITVRSGSSGAATLSGANGSGTATFSGTVTLNKAVTVDAASGGTVVFSGLIDDGASTYTLTKGAGTGTVRLTRAGGNTFSGAVTISAGTLAGTEETSWGDANNAVTINGGTMRYEYADANESRSITLGTGSPTIQVWNSSDAVNLTAAFGGTGTLTKNGAGTLAIDPTVNNSARTAATTISDGTLQIAGTAATPQLSLGSGAITVNLTTSSGRPKLDARNDGDGTATPETINYGNQINLICSSTAYSYCVFNVDRIGGSAANKTIKFGALPMTINGQGASVTVSGGNGCGIEFGAFTMGTNREVISWSASAPVTLASVFWNFAGDSRPMLITNTSDFTVTGSIMEAQATGGNQPLSLWKGGAGTLSLNGNSNPPSANYGYSGVTIVNAGTLKLGNAGALGRTNGGVGLVSGATLDLNGQTIASEALSATEATYMPSQGTARGLAGTGVGGNGALINSSGSPASWGGGVTLTAAATVGAGDIAINGVISGAFDLTKTGAGVLTIGGAGDNTFGAAKAVNVNGGTLALAKTVASDYATDSTSITVGASGTIRWDAGDQLPNTAVMTVNGGTLNIQGNNETITTLTSTGAAAISGTGAGTLTLSAATATAVQVQNATVTAPLALSSTTTSGVGITFDAANNGTLTVGAINLNSTATASITRTFTINNGSAATDTEVNGVIGNTTATTLDKAGSGTLLLSGNNTFTGGITVSAGPLVITGSNSAAGAVAVNGGTATITGANGAIASASGYTIANGRTLTLDNTSADNADRMSGGTVTMQGGTLRYLGVTGGASTETIGTVSCASGDSTLESTPGSGGSNVLTLGGVSSSGGTVLFTGAGLAGASNKIMITGGSDGMIGAWATAYDGVNTGYAGYDATGGTGVYVITGSSIHQLNDPDTVNVVYANVAQDTLTATRTHPAVQFTGDYPVNLGGFSLNINGIAQAGGTTGSTMSNGTVAAGAALLSVTTDTDLTISASVTGSGGLTKLSAGTLTLTSSGTATWGLTGTVTIDAGTLTFNHTSGTLTASNSILGSGAISKTGGGTVVFDTNTPTHSGGTAITAGTLLFNRDATARFGTGTVTLNGGKYLRRANLAAGANYNDAGNFSIGGASVTIQTSNSNGGQTGSITFTGQFSGSGGVNLVMDDTASNGTAYMALSGNNTGFGGTMALSRGDGNGWIRFNAANAINVVNDGAISWTDTNLAVAVNYAGATEAQLNKLAPGANCLVGIDGGFNIDLSSPTLLWANVSTVRLCSSQNITYTGTITPPANQIYRFGMGGGTLTISGANKLTDGASARSVAVYGGSAGGAVALVSANNYSGGTTVNTGATLETRISGAMGSNTVTLAGGTLYLTTANQTHANDIVVTASNGTLQPGSTLTYELSGDITLTGNLTVDNTNWGTGVVTLSGDISGTGGIRFPNGANSNYPTLRITGNNSFQGGVSIAHSGAQAGYEILQIGHDNALGTAALTVGVLSTKGIGIEATNGARNLPNALTLSASNTSSGSVGQIAWFQGSDALAFNGTVSITTIQSAVIKTQGTGMITFAGPVTGSTWGLLKWSSGTLQLSSAASTYTGTTRIDNGSLWIGANAPSGSAGALGNSATTVEVGRIRLQDVRAASTANVTRSGEQTIDTVALVSGDRVLLKNQTTSEENGVYVVSAGAWSRSTDLDASGEFAYGTTVKIAEGGRRPRTTTSIPRRSAGSPWAQPTPGGPAVRRPPRSLYWPARAESPSAGTSVSITWARAARQALAATTAAAPARSRARSRSAAPATTRARSSGAT